MQKATPLIPIPRARPGTKPAATSPLAHLYDQARAVQDEAAPFFAPRMIASFCFGLVVALGLQQWLAPFRSGPPRSGALFNADSPPVIPMPPASQPGSGASSTTATDQRNKLTLASVFQADARSPFGRSSAGVSTDAALVLADAHLRGLDNTQRNRLEAGYWLRHALGPTFRDPRVPWALTQLGSINAAPDAGVPDFKSASLVWQIAGSMGDPVATCYLARMHEFGIGVERDPETARRIYGIAMKAGGCPGLTDAIGRLQ